MSRRGRLLTVPQLVTAVVAVVLAVAAGVTVVIALPPVLRAASPDIPVTAYLRALSRGDVSAALKLGQISPPRGTTLLTTDAYAKASDHITSFRITNTTVAGGTATVTARIVQAEVTYTAKFTALRSAAPLPWLAPWKLAPQQLPQVMITVTGPPSIPVTVAGATFTAKSDTMSESALPGTYTASVASTADYTAAPRSVIALLGQPGGEADLNVALTSAGKAAVQASAHSWLVKCAASSSLTPSGCPFRAIPTAGVTYSAGRWAITSDPTLTVGGWSSAAGGWQVETSAPGSVTFTASASDGDESGIASTGPRAFSVVGTGAPSGGGVAFVPSPSYVSATAGSAA